METTVREEVSPEERHLEAMEVKLGLHTQVSEELRQVERLWETRSRNQNEAPQSHLEQAPATEMKRISHTG